MGHLCGPDFFYPSVYNLELWLRSPYLRAPAWPGTIQGPARCQRDLSPDLQARETHMWQVAQVGSVAQKLQKYVF